MGFSIKSVTQPITHAVTGAVSNIPFVGKKIAGVGGVTDQAAGAANNVAGSAAGNLAGGAISPNDIQSMIDKYMPTYKSPLGADGKLQDGFKVGPQSTVTAGQITAPAALKAGQVDPSLLDTSKLGVNQDALNAIKARAMSVGDSPWLSLQKQLNETNRVAGMDTAAQQAESAAGNARSQLAMHGGLESGAAERIATSSGRDMNAARQAVNRSAQTNALNLGIADDQTKMGLLAQVPGMDLANANYNAGLQEFNTNTKNTANQFNVGAANDFSKFNTGMAFDANKANVANTLSANEFNAGATNSANVANANNSIGALGGENNFNLGKYAQQMMGYAAGQTGNAIAAGGKKGIGK